METSEGFVGLWEWFKVEWFKVERVAPISTRIWQGFSLIFISVSPRSFKEITDNSLLENPLESCQLWEQAIWALPWE